MEIIACMVFCTVVVAYAIAKDRKSQLIAGERTELLLTIQELRMQIGELKERIAVLEDQVRSPRHSNRGDRCSDVQHPLSDRNKQSEPSLDQNIWIES